MGIGTTKDTVGFPGAQPIICLQWRRPGFDPWVGKILWRSKWQPIPVFLPGKFHLQRTLVCYSPWDRIESDTTEQLSLSLALVLEHVLLGCAGSVVQALRLSCSKPCGIFLEGSNPHPLQQQVDSQPLDHQGSSRINIFKHTILS